MTLLATLVALVTLSPLQAPDAQGVRLAGRDVPLKFPVSTADLKMPDAYLNWRGWSFLPEKRLDPWIGATDSGSYAAIQDALSKLSVERAVQWHTKIFVLERVDILDTYPDGTVAQRRSSMETPDVQMALESIARFMAMVKVQSHGKIAIVPDVDIEHEPMKVSSAADWEGRRDQIVDYVSPRINGGAFEADDKVFRGPFQDVMVLHPGLERLVADAVTMGAPIVDIPLFAGSNAGKDDGLDFRIYDAWLGSLNVRSENKWLKGDDKGPSVFPHMLPAQFAPEANWAEVADPNPATADALATRLRPKRLDTLSHGTAKSLVPRDLDFKAFDPRANDSWHGFGTGYHSANVTGSVVTDVDRGNVLRYSERGTSREGRLTSPFPVNPLTDAKYLSFWVKSTARDGLSVEALNDLGDQRVYVVIGRDATCPYGVKEGGSDVIQTAFRRDGTWQRIIVDLSKTRLNNFAALSIGPSPNGRNSERQSAEPIVYDFDDFRLLKTLDSGVGETLQPAPVSDFNSRDPWERILALSTYAKNPTPDAKQQALKLLSDADDGVRLNATVLIGKLKDSDAEQGLTANAGNLDPRIDEAALVALADLGTDAAWTTIRHALLSGPTDLARITSAKLLATKKDATLAGPISVLMAQPSWEARQAAAEAVGSLPGREASIILMAFLQDLNPAVRLAATQSADVTQDYACGKLLYSAVNDPSDSVRAWSCVKLIGSPIESFRSEGYKGVRDDSRAVRILILQQLALHPNEAHRGALRIAVADADPEVRAGALRAFAAMPGTVSNDEISNTLGDRHPWVQAALVELAMAKKMSLPRQTLLELKASADGEVAKKAKELGA